MDAISPKYKPDQTVYMFKNLFNSAEYMFSEKVREYIVIAVNVRQTKDHVDISYELAYPNLLVANELIEEKHIYPTKEEAEKVLDQYNEFLRDIYE